MDLNPSRAGFLPLLPAVADVLGLLVGLGVRLDKGLGAHLAQHVGVHLDHTEAIPPGGGNIW